MKIQLQKERIKKEIDSINDETYLHAIQLLIEDAVTSKSRPHQNL
ncbi:MAG: hypothetical protein ABI723_09535 [Bacteroidia bacterium]